MDANDLLLFAQVVDSGSFTRAAERMKLPKSTVSRRIAQLETELGERLLQRSTRKLLITDFGEKVLAHGRQVLSEVEQTQALAQHRQVLPSGRLRVSMPSDFANSALPLMLADYVKAHPQVRLELDLSARRVDLIAEGFDLAMRMGELPSDSLLNAKRLAVFRIGLFASPAYVAQHEARHGPLSRPEDLQSVHGLLIMPRSGDARHWRLHPHRGEDAPREIRPASQTLANSPEALMRLAELGCGVAALTEFFVEPHLKQGQLVRVLPDWHTDPAVAWAVFPGRRLMPAKTRAFLDALSAAFASCNEEEASC